MADLELPSRGWMEGIPSTISFAVVFCIRSNWAMQKNGSTENGPGSRTVILPDLDEKKTTSSWKPTTDAQ